jgi:hypothetical protein
MPVKLRKQLTKTSGKPRLTGLPNKNYLTTVGGSESGATVAITLAVVLAVIAGTAVVAQRSFDGFIGSRFQGRAKDARLTAEAGTAFIISEWNRPRNRGLYRGSAMSGWNSGTDITKNQCTAGAENGFNISSASEPESDATQFFDGRKVNLAGDPTRRFRLAKAVFTPSPDGETRLPSFTTTPTSFTGTQDPIGSINSRRGFLELHIEGYIYNGDNEIAKSTIVREFIIEPKCCDRSFGILNPNDPSLGNDSRPCPGRVDPPLGDIALVSGLNEGGLASGAGSGSLNLKLQDGTTNLNQVSCIPIADRIDCGGSFRNSRIRVSGGGRDSFVAYGPKPINIDSPPGLSGISELSTSIPAIITDNLTIGYGVEDGEHDFCSLDTHPEDGSMAYHCRISSITLRGGKQLAIDTTNYPVYLYLQEGASSSINLTGSGSTETPILHKNENGIVGFEGTTDFQIRGLRKDSPSCDNGQSFTFTGNSNSSSLIWAPCANTIFSGTTSWNGILWTNDLNLSGNATLNLAIPNNNSRCSDFANNDPSRPAICDILTTTAPNDWSARSINFTKFF